MTPGQQLAALFDRELVCLRQLRDVLGREQQALLEVDVLALEQATREKNQVLVEQVELARQRQEFSDRAGISDDNDALQAFFSGCENRAELVECRTALQALARQCHEANRSNGRMIAQKQQHTQGALGILRQVEPAAPTYSGDGDAQGGRSSRLLGKA